MSETSPPMISCLMPTRNRRDFVAQSLRYFQVQDYPRKELIVVDDGDDKVVDLIPESDEFLYMSRYGRYSVGQKRNIAATLATGHIFCQWDDDDYYGPHRLSVQAEPILAGRAQVSALRMSLLLATANMTLWACPDAIHASLFEANVRCGTLMYTASSFTKVGVRYQHTSDGEDVHFLRSLLTLGASMEAIISPESYICVRHGANTSRDIDDVGTPNWQPVELDHYFSEQDVRFYESMREEKPPKRR